MERNFTKTENTCLQLYSIVEQYDLDLKLDERTRLLYTEAIKCNLGKAITSLSINY